MIVCKAVLDTQERTRDGRGLDARWHGAKRAALRVAEIEKTGRGKRWRRRASGARRERGIELRQESGRPELPEAAIAKFPEQKGDEMTASPRAEVAPSKRNTPSATRGIQ